MRVSTAYSFDSTVYELQRRQDELTHAQEQMNSGKRVLKPGDDPTAAAQAERALVEEARGKQLQRTIDNSRNVMGLTESALGSAIELSQQAREALVLAGNGSYTASGRQALAETLKQARDELFSVSNQTDAAGNLLFGRQGENSARYIKVPGASPDDWTVSSDAAGGRLEGVYSDAGTPRENLPLSIEGRDTWLGGSTDVFTTLNNAIGLLQTDGATNEQVSQAVTDGIAGLDSVLDRFQSTRAEVGAILNGIDSIESRNSGRILAAQTTRSNVEDIDMVEAISSFTNKQTSYQAALQSYAMVQKLSLFNYING